MTTVAAHPTLRVDIAVCTFRRAALAQTLASLAWLSVPERADRDIDAKGGMSGDRRHAATLL